MKTKMINAKIMNEQNFDPYDAATGTEYNPNFCFEMESETEFDFNVFKENEEFEIFLNQYNNISNSEQDPNIPSDSLCSIEGLEMIKKHSNFDSCTIHRRRRGNGEESQKKDPNDHFNFQNKPCYHYLQKIASDIFQKKCTSKFLKMFAETVERVNPDIPKRTRMEQRRKNVLLSWFHRNWGKIYQIRGKIIEELLTVDALL